MKLRVASSVLLMATALFTSACSSTANGLAAFDGRSAEEIIEELDQTPVTERATTFRASIHADELILSDQSEQISIEMPADKFYVSVAPYTSQTHDCFYHSLTTCTGELSNAPITVTIISDSGDTIIDESTTTFDNGFIGMWLPRNLHGTLTIEYEGLTATQPISTDSDAPTCITTTRLF